MGLPTQRLYPFLKTLSWFFKKSEHKKKPQENLRFFCTILLSLVALFFFRVWLWIQPCGF
jgi:dolichol kinase